MVTFYDPSNRSAMESVKEPKDVRSATPVHTLERHVASSLTNDNADVTVAAGQGLAK